MPKEGPSKSVAVAVFIAVAASVVAADLWTKEAVFKLLQVESAGSPPRVIHQEKYVVIPQLFELEANYNYGAFSGWFSRHTGFLTLLSAAALVVIALILLYQLRQRRGPGILFTLALSLLWGGTLGNLHDRYLLRAVRDWIKWFYVTGEGSDRREHVWPNFNIADSAICVGVGLLVLLEIRSSSRERRAKKEQELAAA